MAHEIESRNGKDAMAYNSERGLPWHGLGTPLAGDATVDEMLEAADLNWGVTLEPLYVQTPSGLVVPPNAPALNEVPDTFAITRDDDGKVLGTAGKVYADLSNRELLEFGLDIVKQAADIDLKVGIDTAMSLRGGRVVVANIVLPNVLSLFGDDIHDLNLGVYTSHDGSKSLGADIGMIRRVCMNTHLASMAAAKSSVKIRHTRTMRDRMAVAARTLGLALDYSKQFGAVMEGFAAEEFTLPMVDQFLEALFEAEAPKPGEKITRKIATAEKLRGEVKANLLHSETIQPDLRFTKFGIYMATTEWVDHLRDVRTDKRVDRAEQMVLTQMPGGTGHAIKGKAFALLG